MSRFLTQRLVVSYVVWSGAVMKMNFVAYNLFVTLICNVHVQLLWTVTPLPDGKRLSLLVSSSLVEEYDVLTWIMI